MAVCYFGFGLLPSLLKKFRIFYRYIVL